jgi:GNAT superfamily N-acetyltransferase
MGVSDIPAGMRLCRAAGWNQLEDDWRIFLDSGGGFLVEKDERAAGSVVFVQYGDFAWIAMMLVDPEERRSGIGTQLMEAVLAALSNVPCVGLDASLMGEPLYRRFGLVSAYHLARMKATIEAARFGNPSGPAHRMTARDLADVLSRDREVFGADRGHLLASLQERAPECAWVVKDDGAVRGYCLGRPGRLYYQLGPVVADEPDTARRLVAHCLSQLDGKTLALDAPRLDGEWLAWLESVGFAEDRPFIRMFRHGDKPPGMPDRQYAITGPEFA